jgi:EAL domain-containing protein (putative c-di-GMP-specific phosphodiesterase class I)
LLKQVDLAMYRAKQDGRNNLRFFDPQMQAAVMARSTLEDDLRQGLQQGQFLLHYQPQIDASGKVTGVEALLRWQHPLRGLVFPNDFIACTEETGLILPLGLWVLETACRQLRRWADQPALAALCIAVNVSARQFHHPDFAAQILALLADSGIDGSKLKLELTESLLLENVDGVIAKMQTIKARGVGFSLDDFGTGYSSLSCLKRLPLDQLKIDRSFVRDILVDTNDADIAGTIVALAQSMGLEVIAEGVENDEQRQLLQQLGCHAYQGYLFARPRPVSEFERWAQGG